MLAIGTGQSRRMAAAAGQRDHEASRAIDDVRVRHHVAAVVEHDTGTEAAVGLYLHDCGRDRLDDLDQLLLKLFGSARDGQRGAARSSGGGVAASDAGTPGEAEEAGQSG